MTGTQIPTDGRCRELDDPDQMFPDHDQEQIAAAKAVCRGCPVIQQCGEAIMRIEGDKDRKNRYGIFAGMTPGERHQLFKRYPGRWPSGRPGPMPGIKQTRQQAA